MRGADDWPVAMDAIPENRPAPSARVSSEEKFKVGKRQHDRPSV